MDQYVERNCLSEISQKNVFWATWVILDQLWPQIMQAYIATSVLRIFSKLSSMERHNNRSLKLSFPKILFGPNGQFLLECVPKLHKLLLEDWLYGLFYTLQHDNTQ